MGRIILFLMLTVVFMPGIVKAQRDTVSAQAKTDTSVFTSNNYIAKTGYSLVPLPEFQIDPFVGLYLGVYATVFDYGDGKIYPNYYQSLTLAAAYGTKGKTNFGFEYLNYGRFLLSAKGSYTISTMYPFYGYNGYQTTYNANYHNPDSPDYITSPFYNYEQKVARMAVFVQDTISGTFFNWQVGADVARYSTTRVNFGKLNKGIDEADLVPDTLTLYDRYVNWGLIDANQKNGGWANALRAALVYDTRDRLTNPMHGMWTDITFRFAPNFLGNPTQAVQMAITHRHYITLYPDRLSLAYRLRYDACFGELPFYSRQFLADGTEGFGGTGTLWGLHQNRVITQQFAMGNFELRAKLVRFKFIQQNWYVAAVPIFHTGYLIKPIEMDLSALSESERSTYFTDTHRKWYSTYGLGAKLVMNENTVIGFDWAHAIDNEAGADAIYVGFGYSF